MRPLTRYLSVAIVLAPISSTAPAQEAAPTVTKKLTLGCESCGGPAQFGSIWDVSVTPAGDILVTDRDLPPLRKFDVTGRSTWSGGRKGPGPGEYSTPTRVALLSSGIAIVDMKNMRITELDATGKLTASMSLTQWPASASANERGDLVIGADDFRGTFKVSRRVRGVADTVLQPVHSYTRPRMKNSALAVAPDGSIAVVLDNTKYEIQRLDPSGNPLTPLLRDVAQVRRTPEEEVEFRKLVSRDKGMVAAAMEAKFGKSGNDKPVLPAIPADELSLKPHLATDAPRFDGGGRLWVLTMRGDGHSTVFDVFSRSGTFVGSVKLPTHVTHFSLGGGWLVTAGENEDGVPEVVLWAVR